MLQAHRRWREQTNYPTYLHLTLIHRPQGNSLPMTFSSGDHDDDKPAVQNSKTMALIYFGHQIPLQIYEGWFFLTNENVIMLQCQKIFFRAYPHPKLSLFNSIHLLLWEFSIVVALPRKVGSKTRNRKLLSLFSRAYDHSIEDQVTTFA